MLVMGGTRTSHRLACAIEDTGFIIKDTLMWIYGSGFPKAQEASVLVDAKILGISTKEVKEKREVIGKAKHPTSQDRTSNKSPYQANNHLDANFNITLPLTSEGEHWDGFKVGGIKPAYEPIIWAVKPPEGSYVDNVLKWGVGAVNVAQCRIGYQSEVDKQSSQPQGRITGGIQKFAKIGRPELDDIVERCPPKGRFPANVILSHHPECVQVGVKKVRGLGGSGRASDKGHGFQTKYVAGDKKGEGFNGGFVDENGYETVESWNCHPDCAVRLLNEQSGVSKSIKSKRGGIESGYDYGSAGKMSDYECGFNDSGGASRFFYCAKASRSERNAGLEGMEEKNKSACYANGQGMQGRSQIDGEWKNTDTPRKAKTNSHPTVKPIKLFEWLIRLVTREGQMVLDPFIGSGTTIIATYNTGRKCIGIEKEEEYIEIARRRATHWRNRPRQLEII